MPLLLCAVWTQPLLALDFLYSEVLTTDCCCSTFFLKKGIDRCEQGQRLICLSIGESSTFPLFIQQAVEMSCFFNVLCDVGTPTNINILPPPHFKKANSSDSIWSFVCVILPLISKCNYVLKLIFKLQVILVTQSTQTKQPLLRNTEMIELHR